MPHDATDQRLPHETPADWLRGDLYARVGAGPALFDLLQGQCLDGIWYWSLEPPYSEWLSPQFKALFGDADRDGAAPPGWWTARIHPEDRPAAREAFERHKADPDHPYDVTVRCPHRDGRTLWVRCRGAILRDETGRPLRMLGGLTDITSIKQKEEALEGRNREMHVHIVELQDQEQRLEAQAEELVTLAESLEQARADLEELNAQKDKFFSIIAHDLKSPFNPLLGFSELLAAEGADLPRDRVSEYGALLHRAATEAFKLLEDLLDWSRIQLDRIDYDPGAVSLSELIERNIARYQYAAQAKGVRLRTDAVEEHVAWADPRMLDTVARNLLSNAIKFTRSGDSIAFATSTDHGSVVLTIRDTGVGMTAEKAAGLFQVGAYRSVVGTGGETGTGMGLIICKELVDRMGGTIRVDSTPGDGTTFILTLPQA